MIKKENFFVALMCMILSMILAWQLRSTYNNSKSDESKSVRMEVLKDELIATKNLNEGLRSRNQELVNQIKEYENDKGNYTLYEKNLRGELERARMIAGLTEVEGKGIIIEVDNADGEVEQDDILKLLNELKASDAQALSVNGERIISTSEVRKAGRYIIINGKQCLAPFEIKAIAPKEKVENAISMIGGILEELRELYKLSIDVKKVDRVVIPKIKDDGSSFNVDMLKKVK